MNDRQLEQTLRASLISRADTVSHGPTWDESEEALDLGRPPRRSHARLLAPLAAAAVVLAVVGGLFAFRSDHDSNPSVHSGLAPAGQPSVPRGMTAVDALGVELFVPKSMTIDAGPCATGVSRPVAPPQSWRGAKCVTAPKVSIAPAGRLRADPSVPCGATVVLGNERACIQKSVGDTARWTLVWPEHDVAVTAQLVSTATALKVLESAHAVPVDRNGCAAADDALLRGLPRHVPDPADIQFDGLPLPTKGVRGMSVCWYVDNRLVASALLTAGAAQQIARAVDGLPATWPHGLPQPALPTCASVAAHDGVLLRTRMSTGTDIDAIAQLAACNGQRTVSTGSRGVLVEQEFAVALAEATGIPFSYGYPTTR